MEGSSAPQTPRKYKLHSLSETVDEVDKGKVWSIKSLHFHHIQHLHPLKISGNYIYIFRKLISHRIETVHINSNLNDYST